MIDAADAVAASGATMGRGVPSHVGSRIGYAGYTRDAYVPTVSHVRHRVYKSDLGRWLQRDPAGYVDGPSLYEYAMSAPQSFTDSWGLASTRESIQQARMRAAAVELAQTGRMSYSQAWTMLTSQSGKGKRRGGGSGPFGGRGGSGGSGSPWSDIPYVGLVPLPGYGGGFAGAVACSGVGASSGTQSPTHPTVKPYISKCKGGSEAACIALSGLCGLIQLIELKARGGYKQPALDAETKLCGSNQHNNRCDAFRHCYWSCLLSTEVSHYCAKAIGECHEACGGNPQNEIDMDTFNNRIGRQFGKKCSWKFGKEAERRCCYSKCAAASKDGTLQTKPK